MRDGGLRQLFRKHLPEAHWQAVETWSTGMGVPDCEYCFPGGHQGWIEFKEATAYAVDVRPGQIAWLEHRARVGGRAFIAVRRRDLLHIYDGADARAVKEQGMRLAPICAWDGGPARWAWDEIRVVLGA